MWAVAADREERVEMAKLCQGTPTKVGSMRSKREVEERGWICREKRAVLMATDLVAVGWVPALLRQLLRGATGAAGATVGGLSGDERMAWALFLLVLSKTSDSAQEMRRW